jgi:membrane protease YdiL (CAAX protease family)
MTLRPDYRRHITAPLLVLSVFVLLRLTSLIDTALLNRENEYAATILLQIVVFIMPAAVYMALTGGSVAALRIRPVGVGHILILISAVALLTSGSLLINLRLAGYGYLESRYNLYGIFVSKNSGSAGDVIYHVLAYAALPAVCEEYLFRGVLCGEYDREGTAASLLMSSLFFALLHFDLRMFPTFFFAGLVLALVFYACRSLVASVAVHLVYNLFSLFGRTVIQTLYDLGGSRLFTFICGGVFLFSAFVFCAEAARLYGLYSSRGYPSSYRDPVPRRRREGQTGILSELSEKHPRASGLVKSLLHPAALACYVFYAVVILT